LAAHEQGKYFEYHVALMEHRGPKEEAALMKLATDTGLDAEKLKADANSEKIAAQLEKDMVIAREVGAQGTPAFIIGTQFIPGYVGEEGLKTIIAEERAKLAE
jgi:protein-disulfide isomerase